MTTAESRDKPKPGWIALLSTPDDDRSQITETVRGGRRLGPAPDGDGQAAPLGSGWSDETVAALGCTREEAEAFWREYHAPHITTAPAPAPAFTWAESVASYGIGPTATVDIDVHAPGYDEPVPVEIPLAEARVLYAMLGGILAEHGVTPRTARLRERLERAYTEGFRLSCQITDLRCELTDERTRAEQAEDLLRVAHDTSNRSEAERALAVQRAEQAEAALARVSQLAERWRYVQNRREAADSIRAALANPPAGGQETGADQAGERAAIVTGTDDDYCGSEPPMRADEPGTQWGDCWCTLRGNHDGDCVCEPCRDRNGAPSWPNPNATAREEPTP